MFFNYDLFEIVAVAFVVSGIFTFSIYKSSPINNDSLVNTNSSLNSISNIQLDNLPNQSYVEASVQTVDIGVETTTTYVNTGMQTSPRMWLESIRNWINEILGSSPSNPSMVEGYVDVGVQTVEPSFWVTVKHWLFQVCSVRSSELGSIGHGKVSKWMDKLESVQSVDLHDSETPLDSTTPLTNLDLLIDPNDSSSQRSYVLSNLSEGVSNISEVVNNVGLVSDNLAGIDPMFISTTVSGIQYVDPIMMMMF